MLPTSSDSGQSVYCNPLVKSKGKLYAFNIQCHRINITVPKEELVLSGRYWAKARPKPNQANSESCCSMNWTLLWIYNSKVINVSIS